MDAGGWPMLNMWLVEAKKTQNTALLVELLKVHVTATYYYILTIHSYMSLHLVTNFDIVGVPVYSLWCRV